jgi:3',5'-cyclic AMP phosphodiesterase CpdA
MLAAVLIFLAVFTVLALVGCRAVFDYIDTLTPVDYDAATFSKATVERDANIRMGENTDNLRILQISDTHFCCSLFTIGRDLAAARAIVALVLANQPDLVVLTGDISYPVYVTGSINNRLTTEAVALIFDKLQLPYAVVFGNHDAEPIALWNKDKQMAYYETQRYFLGSAGPKTIDGVGNYAVDVLNADGTSNTTLYMLDSGSRGKGDRYDYIHDNQVEWYRGKIKQSQAPQSLMFVHIPLYEYFVAHELMEMDDGAIEYIRGVKEESISSEKLGRGKMFDAIVDGGSTKAVFCGHDHVNNFALRYKGVVLAYGMSIDYVAYPFIARKTAQRGGQLIEVNEDGTVQMALCREDDGFVAGEWAVID